MAVTPTHHATLVFEREISASPAAVFAAIADPAARELWGPPSDTGVLVYEDADFGEGGLDRFRCGPKDNPYVRGVTRYLDVVPGRRVISSETLVADGRRLCASLSTLELIPEGGKTRLKNTSQLVSFTGEDMVKDYATAANTSFDSLVRYFER
jgi:uncharacterized protein YndB with AHSA1/START domain